MRGSRTRFASVGVGRISRYSGTGRSAVGISTWRSRCRGNGIRCAKCRGNETRCGREYTCTKHFSCSQRERGHQELHVILQQRLHPAELPRATHVSTPGLDDRQRQSPFRSQFRGTVVRDVHVLVYSNGGPTCPDRRARTHDASLGCGACGAHDRQPTQSFVNYAHRGDHARL